MFFIVIDAHATILVCFCAKKKTIRIIYNRMEQLILFKILCLRNEIERELNGKQIQEYVRKLRTRWVKKCVNIAQSRKFLKSLQNPYGNGAHTERNLHMKAISSIYNIAPQSSWLGDRLRYEQLFNDMLACKSVSPFEALINRICERTAERRCLSMWLTHNPRWHRRDNALVLNSFAASLLPLNADTNECTWNYSTYMSTLAFVFVRIFSFNSRCVSVSHSSSQYLRFLWHFPSLWNLIKAKQQQTEERKNEKERKQNQSTFGYWLNVCATRNCDSIYRRIVHREKERKKYA